MVEVYCCNHLLAATELGLEQNVIFRENQEKNTHMINHELIT